jgi:TonB family protein
MDNRLVLCVLACVGALCAAGFAGAQEPRGPSPQAGTVRWDRGPTAADFAHAYPKRALKNNVAGRVDLSCEVGFNGRLTCTVMNERPRGWGFADAALEVAKTMWAAPRMSNGSPSANAMIIVPIEFNPGQ